MVIHLLQEEHIRIKCMYCKEDLSKREDWRSEFAGHEHYKSVTCNCGKESWIRVGFSGSGHDFWDGSASWILPNNAPKTQENKNTERNEEDPRDKNVIDLQDKEENNKKANDKKTLEESI